MPLKYKELETLAKSEKTTWTPEGTPSLYAVARGTGSIFWIVRVSFKKRRSVVTIGKWPNVKAEVARELSPSIKALVRQGYSDDTIKNALKLTNNPQKLLMIVEGQKVKSDGPTLNFETFARNWYENHLKGGLSEGPYKRKVIQQLSDHIFPTLGDRAINEIKRKEIVSVLSPLWISKKPTAVKIRGNIERIFEHAIDYEMRDDNPTPSVAQPPI